MSDQKVEYLVVGGMAVNYYGHHRATGDLDLWVAVTPDNQDRLAAALKRFGFSEQAVSKRPLLCKPKFIRIGNPPLRVEIHSELSGVSFDECFARSEVAVIEGVNVRFISLDDLVQNKRAAGRTKDLADIEVLSRRGEGAG